jgi:hypothetical protein
MIRMPTNAHTSVLLIGGPDAGKSNFLFRLWIAIDDGRGALVKNGLPTELEHLRHGAERLLEGEFAEHTSKDGHVHVVVPVKSAVIPTTTGILVVPDISGEQILAIVRNRQWSEEWENLISQRCGCLLFVRAGSDEVVAPLDPASCFERYGSVIRAPEHANRLQGAAGFGAAGPDGFQTEDEKAAQTPTQVVLTEWLQFLSRAFTSVAGGSFRPRVGVVVSAWDAVPRDQQEQPEGPVQYLQNNFPMLYQFIETNDNRFDFKVFGVSIVAGDLKNDDEFREAYLSGSPRHSGFILHSLSGGPFTKSTDITLPVAWALRLLPDPS